MANWDPELTFGYDCVICGQFRAYTNSSEQAAENQLCLVCQRLDDVSYSIELGLSKVGEATVRRPGYVRYIAAGDGRRYDITIKEVEP